MKTKQSRRFWSRLATMLLPVIAVATSVACVFNMARLNTLLERQTESYLNDVSIQMAETVNLRLEKGLETMLSLADTVAGMEREDLPEYFERKVRLFDFLWFGIVDLQGQNWFAGDDMVDFPSVGAFQQASTGTPSVSPFHYQDGDIECSALLYCVPVYQRGRISAVLVSFESSEAVQEQLESSSFESRSSSALLTVDGDVVTASPQTRVFNGIDNVFTDLLANSDLSDEQQEKLRQAMRNGEADRVDMQWGDNDLIIQYLPLSTGNFCLLTVIYADMFTAGTHAIMAMFIISIIMIFLYTAAFLFVSHVQRRSRTELERIAFTDPVTEGANLAYFNIHAEETLKDAAGGDYVMISMDIENFKLINDLFTDHEGNRTLQYVYQVITDHLKEDELAARSYADVFLILVRNSGVEGVAERLRQLVDCINSFNEELEIKYYLVVKFGVYMIDDPALNLISIEDRATSARRSSRPGQQRGHCICTFYDGTEQQRRRQETEIANIMEAALENREFQVYLQPKVNLKTGQIAGAEALVRWHNPKRGMLSPGLFIPTFEKNGFIVRLDLYMFSEVCRILDAWTKSGLPAMPISVNLSRRHLEKRNFLENYIKIYRQYDFPASLIEFELTETMAFDNMDILTQVIDTIHSMGFHCSMDDFGSGYSSLGMLKNIHVDTLKIDRAFFLDNRDQRGQTVIETVIELGHKLNISTVAEGIETQEQVDFLASINCDMVQGYVFYRPMPLGEFEKTAFKDEKSDSSREEEQHSDPHC